MNRELGEILVALARPVLTLGATTGGYQNGSSAPRGAMRVHVRLNVAILTELDPDVFLHKSPTRVFDCRAEFR